MIESEIKANGQIGQKRNKVHGSNLETDGLNLFQLMETPHIMEQILVRRAPMLV